MVLACHHRRDSRKRVRRRAHFQATEGSVNTVRDTSWASLKFMQSFHRARDPRCVSGWYLHCARRAAQRRIATCIRGGPRRMASAIDLDHEVHRRRAKVDDVRPEQRHLSSKLSAQLARTKRRPKPQLRRRHHPPIRPSKVRGQPRRRSERTLCAALATTSRGTRPSTPTDGNFRSKWFGSLSPRAPVRRRSKRRHRRLRSLVRIVEYRNVDNVTSRTFVRTNVLRMRLETTGLFRSLAVARPIFGGILRTSTCWRCCRELARQLLLGSR